MYLFYLCSVDKLKDENKTELIKHKKLRPCQYCMKHFSPF